MTLEQPVRTTTNGKNSDEIQSSDLGVLAVARELQEESTLISQLWQMERAHSAEVFSSVRRLLEANGKSFRLNPELFSRIDKNVNDIVLSPQGIICLISANGQCATRPIENLSTESLVRVLGQILPDIKATLADRRRKLSARAGILERMADELKGISEAAFPKGRSARTESSRSPSQPPKGEERSPRT